jgi:hypothetical protein
VGFAGLVFVAIAVLWLIYLVPLFLHRTENGLLDEIEPGEPFTPTVTIVRRGVPLDTAEDGAAVVSTPLNRRAALRELDLLQERAASRRRVVLAVLLALTALVGLGGATGGLPWWSVGVPVGLTAAFVGIARYTVVAMTIDLDARARRIRSAGERAEETVPIKVLRDADDDPHEATVDLTAPIQAVASLWDPVPIVKPTYVSKPLAPRTVRTIDLSAPIAPALGGIPVTADAPASPASDEGHGDVVNG